MLYCDFCRKSTKEVKRLIVGSEGVAICNECVMISMELLINETKDKEDNKIQLEKDTYESPKCYKCVKEKETSGLFKYNKTVIL